MDLIRGCGDCYNPNVSNNSKSCMHQKESYLRSSPQIKISPCASPEPLCSNPGQPVGRCAFKYFLKIVFNLYSIPKLRCHMNITLLFVKFIINFC